MSVRAESNNRFLEYMLRKGIGLLPTRLRRMLYVGSFAGMVLHIRDPDLKLVSKMNDVLRLAHRPSGWIPPFMISDVVWQHCKDEAVRLSSGEKPISQVALNETLSDNDCWRIGLFAARNCPESLRYGSDQVMAADIRDTLMALTPTHA